MRFVARLAAYLEDVRAKIQPPKSRMDATWARRQLVALLEQHEREIRDEEAADERTTMYGAWTDLEKDRDYVHFLEESLNRGFLAGATPEVIEQHVLIAFARQLGLDRTTGSEVRDLELSRLSENAFRDARKSWHDQRTDIGAYAKEIRAVRKVHGELVLTAIGSVFLELTGKDALMFLLYVELAQSAGPADPWRISRATIQTLLQHPRREFAADAELDPPEQVLSRLESFNLVRFVASSDGSFRYEVYEYTRSIFEELLAAETPLAVLAATLSQDLTLTMMQGPLYANAERAQAEVGAIAVARQARLVAHEIRNALTPANFALTQLYAELNMGEGAKTVSRLRPKIDPGIARVFSFIGQLLQTFELAARPPEPFDVHRALLDATAHFPLAELEHVPADLPAISGYRDRFVLAIVNLVRNSQQANAKKVAISIQHDRDARAIVVSVEDDGPGLPARILENPFARTGRGEGLPLVREIIELEHHGQAVHVPRAEGGSIFKLKLPAGRDRLAATAGERSGV